MALSQQTAPSLTPSFSTERFSEQPLINDELDDGEEFEDATEEPTSGTMDLQTAFEECEVAVRKFFNNDLLGAMNIMKPWGQSSLYHSLGVSIFEFIPAILTFDNGQINSCLASLKICVAICNQHRRNYNIVESIGTIIKKPNFGSYTDMEAHAELCYAEALLLQAAMTIMEGEDLTGLIKGTFKIRSCYNSYKDCVKILDKKKWDSELSKVQFHSGVRLGTATFNVMISLLPPKIVSLLEFVGFSGNKAYGLAELKAGSRAPGIRSVLCDLTLLGFHLVICHFIGAQGDIKVCEEILENKLKIYPDGVWFLLFKARLELLKGNFDKSTIIYNLACGSQNMWKQFHHMCYWEIMWINAMNMEWREAASYAGKMMDESSWSRTIYAYTKASMLLQLRDTMSVADQLHCNDLMRKAVHYKQRIAGKSLPMEKFIIKRCARYQAQGGHLLLPAVELVCLWNMFHILAKNRCAALKVLKLIESTRESMDREMPPWMSGFEADNRALVRYLHGCCLLTMGLPQLALDAYNSVMQFKSEVKDDTFLIPYTVSEMAICHYMLGDSQQAMQLLHEARKKYTGYSLESRLHFRLHSKIDIVKKNNEVYGKGNEDTDK